MAKPPNTQYSFLKVFHGGQRNVHSLWPIYHPSDLKKRVHTLCMKLYVFMIPCLRTSSTAAVSSSFRNWLSFAIFSPFSRKFWVAVSTEAASTWAFLERPFFLLDGPLLLEFTKVVTYKRSNKLFNSKRYTLVRKPWNKNIYPLQFLKSRKSYYAAN